VHRRFVFCAGTATIRAGGHEHRRELWIGVEVRRDVDVRAFSRDHGYDLVPADDFTADELASIGVRTFALLHIDGDCGNTSSP
jgi:hypothetical protein